MKRSLERIRTFELTWTFVEGTNCPRSPPIDRDGTSGMVAGMLERIFYARLGKTEKGTAGRLLQTATGLWCSYELHGDECFRRFGSVSRARDPGLQNAR